MSWWTSTSLCGLAFAGLATARTPSNYPPSTNNHLDVRYLNGTLIFKPNDLLSINDTVDPPRIAYRHAFPSKQYMLLMFDVSLNITGARGISPNISAVARPGLESGRTTYLHWFQGNLTRAGHAHDGLLGFTCDGSGHESNYYTIAPYVPPGPNEGTTQHTYVFYLFEQPHDFRLPKTYQGRDLNQTVTQDRIGLDAGEIACVRGVGAPIAATFLRAQQISS